MFSDPSTENGVFRNLQLSIPELVTGKKQYDVSVNEKLSWSNLAHQLGYNENEIVILSFGDDSKLVKIESDPNVKVIVVLVTEEYYSQYVSILHIAKSPRCMHKGVLFLQYKNRPLIFVNRREAWSILPTAVSVILSLL